MARHGHRFSDFTDQPRGQDVAGAIPASQGARQPGRNANIGPRGKNLPRGFQRVGLPHARQNRADMRAAKFAFKDRPVSRQAAGNSCAAAMARIPPAPRMSPVYSWTPTLNLRRMRARHCLRAPCGDISVRFIPCVPRAPRRLQSARRANPSSRSAFEASTNILCRAMRTPSSGICGSRPNSRETAVSTHPAA